MITKKILFVINPISGGKNKKNLPELIHAAMQNKSDYKIIFWENAEQDIHAIIKDEIENNNFTMLVAAGGDGTINRIANCIKNTKTTLGIIPLGSGNGFARFLKIPMNTEKALEIITNGKEILIDTCTINDKPFYCTAGVGFDAHIGKLFANANKRGPWTYIKKIISEFRKYNAEIYELNIDGQKITEKAFLITFANANQWGNNAQIAPKANIQDGLINITILKPFNVYNAPILAARLYLKNMHKSRYTSTYTGKEIIVTRLTESPVHFDGEPEKMGNKIEVKIFPKTLSVCVPQSWKS